MNKYKTVTAELPKVPTTFGHRLKRFLKRNWGGWAIMIPSLVLFAFFIWVPLIENISYSFYEIKRFERQSFVGFENYARVFNDPAFGKAVVNTFLYALWSIVIGFLLPLFLGLLLSETVHFKSLFRIGLYIPNIISGMAVVLMWTNILDGSNGSMINGFLSLFGAEPVTVLSNPKWVIPVIVLVMTWRGAGGTVLIYLSALQTVDSTLYEVAKLDGAGVFRRIWNVTLPSIRPTIKLLFLLQIISVFQVFYEPMVMTVGGPDNASISLMYLCYRYTFIDHDPGAGAAVGVMLAIIIGALSIVYFALNRRTKQ